MGMREKYNFSRAEQSRAEQSRAEQSRAEQSRAEQSRRFIGFDILKFICAFFIVCIHTPFPGTLGKFFMALTRIAVPIFFMITGYYYFSIIQRGKFAHQVKRIVRLVVYSNLLYLIWKSFIALAKGSLSEYWYGTFTVKNLLKFIFLNESPFAGHLWYLNAVLYVLIIFMLVYEKGSRKFIYVITPFLLLIDLVFGKYSILFFGREFPYIIVRNFLFVGIPYFAIGMMLREWKKDISKKKLEKLVILFSVTTLIERAILVSIDANATRDQYISTTFLAITVFLLFKEVYQDREANSVEKWMADKGRKCSTWIYIIHPILIEILFAMTSRLGLLDYYQFVAPVAVFAMSVLFVIVMEKVTVFFNTFIEKWGLRGEK